MPPPARTEDWGDERARTQTPESSGSLYVESPERFSRERDSVSTRSTWRESAPLLPVRHRVSNGTASLVHDRANGAGNGETVTSIPTTATIESEPGVGHYRTEDAGTGGSTAASPHSDPDTVIQSTEDAAASNGDPQVEPTQPAGQENGASTTTMTCGCAVGFHDDHAADLRHFVARLKKALVKMPPNRQQYDRVKVLIVYWEDSDLKELRINAQRLGQVFKEHYEYEVDEFELRNESDAIGIDADDVEAVISKKFRRYLDTLLDDIGPVPSKSKNLLILYYAGHGAKTGKNQDRFVWQAKATASCQLQWTDFTGPFKTAVCDKLFIFDCCYALNMMSLDESWRNRCYLLAATGVDQVAAAPVEAKATGNTTPIRSSAGGFTEALINTLTSYDRPRRGMDTDMLLQTMTTSDCVRTYKLNPYPQLRPLRIETSSSNIWLQSKGYELQGSVKDEHSLSAKSYINQMECLSDARILISIRLRNPAENLEHYFAGFLEWLQARPGSVESMSAFLGLHSAVAECLFQSDSSLLLVSMPLWLWNGMPRDPAYKEIGVIRGENVLPSWVAAHQAQAKADAITSKARLRPAMSSIDEKIGDEPHESSPTPDFAMLASPVELFAKNPDFQPKRKFSAKDEMTAVPRQTGGLLHGQKPSMAEPEGSADRTAELRDSHTIHRLLRAQAIAKDRKRGATHKVEPRASQSKTYQWIHQDLERKVPVDELRIRCGKLTFDLDTSSLMFKTYSLVMNAFDAFPVSREKH